MQYAFAVVMINVGISAAMYFGLAGVEKFLLPQVIHSLPFGSWASTASWSSWSPSVAAPVGYTAYKISPKLGGASLAGIVGMWGGFMITDFQQPPFMPILQQLVHAIANPA